MLPVSAQYQKIRLEPQARLSGISTAGQWISSTTRSSDGSSIHLFNVIDAFNRESLGVGVDFSLPAERVVRSLDQIIEWPGKPITMRCDNSALIYHFDNSRVGKKACHPDQFLFHPDGRRKMVISSVTTERFAMTNSHLTCSNPSMRFRNVGYWI